MGKYRREEIVEAARDAAATNGGTLSRAEFQRITGISTSQVYSLFPKGGWSEVQELAGIAEHAMYHTPSSDDDILAEWHRVSESLGRLPKSWNEYSALAEQHKDVIRKRFRGQQGLLARYRTWLEEQGLDAPWLEELQQTPAQPVRASEAQRPEPSVSTWPKTDGREYGAPLDFRGLRHCPINELGVIYLFGMVSSELGIDVEGFYTSSCPDCLAKRRIDRKGERLQSVRIEFEFQSSNFRAHGHNANDCDLIVCWEHDWPDCPLEVVELRSELERLKTQGADRT